MIEVTIAHDKQFNSLSDFAQLLFLKVLPHTDDFGRFEGDAEILKARVDPLSKKPIAKYEQVLIEISEAKLWIRYEVGGGKKVLQYKKETFERINAFLIKKRGNEEYPEYCEQYKLISSDIQSISHSKQQATSNKQQVEGRKETEIFVPIFEDVGLQKAWEEYREHRRQIKKPLTSLAEKKGSAHLLGLAGGDVEVAIKIINQTIASGWQGLFELKEKFNGHSKSSERSSGGVKPPAGKYSN